MDQATFQAIVLNVANFEEGCDNFPNIAISTPAGGAPQSGTAGG